MVGGVRDVITCAEFQIEIFMGYNFIGGRIFDFPIDFSMGLTTGEEGLAIRICRRRLSIYFWSRAATTGIDTSPLRTIRLAVDARTGGKPDIRSEWKRQ